MRTARFLTLVALCAAALGAWAQAYPAKPIRIVVGFPPGGGNDIIARLLGAKMQETWGQSVVIDNRPGAASIIAAEHVAKSAPDGYTLLVNATGGMSVNPVLYAKLPYDSLRDFVPISMVGSFPLVLVVHPSVPANSIAELVALARSAKEPMPYASSGNGSIHHITMELFKADTGINFTHVPFKGAGQSVPAMIAGDVKLGFIGYPAAASAMKTGRLRVLAFSMAKRSNLTPEIPTVAETVDPGFDMSAPLGVFVAARTPREVVARLSRAVIDAVRAPEILERMAAIGMEPAGTTQEQYEKILREEYERIGSLIKRLGIRID